METRNSMSLLFFIKKTKLLKNGKAPIYLRITVNSKRTEIALKISIDPDKWSKDAGMAMQNFKEAREINNFLDSIRVKLLNNYRQLIDDRKDVSAVSLKNSFLGIKKSEHTIISIFNLHNDEMFKLAGLDYVPGTMSRYTISLKYLKTYIEKRYKVKDMDISKIDYEFITNFEVFMKMNRKISHNTAMSYMKGLKKVIRFSLANNRITKNPFLSYKMSYNKVDRGYLTDEELENLLNIELEDIKFEQTRDCFIFSCFTGLAYSDFKRLTRDNIVTGTDGKKWIKINRKKTNIHSSIPILPITQKLIDKHSDNPYCLIHNVLLPVISNQQMNKYLKEIAKKCGITKKITCHLARHTFATTVTLNNNVPIESVSKMLGHSSIKMTAIYARLLDKKVSQDMSKLHEIYK